MYRVKLRTKDTGIKNCMNPPITINHDWQDIEKETPELTKLKRWGEILIEKKAAQKKETDKAKDKEGGKKEDAKSTEGK